MGAGLGETHSLKQTVREHWLGGEGGSLWAPATGGRKGPKCKGPEAATCCLNRREDGMGHLPRDPW